jgi:metal-responsive CopG/Arc/MetJ family transcriptional regulator
MENIDPERLRYKRGPGRPKQAEVMPQISIRIPQWMLDNLDAINEHERHGQSDRASLIREAIAAWIDAGRK